MTVECPVPGKWMTRWTAVSLSAGHVRGHGLSSEQMHLWRRFVSRVLQDEMNSFHPEALIQLSSS